MNSTFDSIRPLMLNAVQTLDEAKLGYASAYFEHKSTHYFMANLKQSNVNESSTSGIVLRIYDGFTLFEEASDDLEPESIKKLVQNLIGRVKKSPKKNSEFRPYRAPSWKDRLAQGLDPEIIGQIPKDVTAKTPVDFRIRVKKDSSSLSPHEMMDVLNGIIARAKQAATKVNMDAASLNFLMARIRTGVEESLFVDVETNMSQRLIRNQLAVAAVSGENRVSFSTGGLGGLECIEIEDQELLEMFSDLKALKSAQKLIPGNYDVVVSPDIAGVIAHEAFGHSQEADTCARGRSRAWDLYKSGELVGNQEATIVNNPAIYRNGTKDFAAWGSYFFDEEGWLAKEHVILDRGKLCTPMTNLTSALRLGVPRTANGKREDWSRGVYSRQTNTYFSAGTHTLGDLMGQIKDGFLATQCAGGMEDPKGMGIQVGILYLHEIKNGVKTGRIFRGPAGGDIQMTGFVPDILRNIVAKTKVEFDVPKPDSAKFPTNDSGGCGKYHKEYVDAGSGGPYMFIKGVTLG